MVKMKKMSLNKKDIKALNERIAFNFQLPTKSRVEVVFINENEKVITLEDKPVLFELNEKIFPTLMLLQERSEIALKKVVVDMGAVKFVANGADVMRPGIVSFDENLAKDEIVLIVDERFGKSLAIGLALLSASELKATDKGKAIKNIHYVGDRIWNFGKV